MTLRRRRRYSSNGLQKCRVSISAAVERKGIEEAMADAISPMDIDHTDEKLNQNSSSKGKSIVVDGVPPPGNKATPWVEKYRPQSLDDVTVHRDIIDTSNHFKFLPFPRVYVSIFDVDDNATQMASQHITEEAVQHVYLCTCRYKLSFGCNDNLQLGSLIASFTGARSALVAAAKCQSRIML
ncbi:Replication factor C subunit 5 [Linum perenne]